MDEDKLHLWSCKYIRYWLFLKMVLFEYLITSMQMIPTVQIVTLMLCQFVTILWLIHALFIGKVFSAWYHAVGDVFIELTLLLFLGMGFLNNITGVTERTLEIQYVSLQIWLIYLILATTAILVVQILIRFVVTGVQEIKKIRLRMKINKAIKANAEKEKDSEASELLKKEIIKIFNEEAVLVSKVKKGGEPEVDNQPEKQLGIDKTVLKADNSLGTMLGSVSNELKPNQSNNHNS